jgi:hypothetical protein
MQLTMLQRLGDSPVVVQPGRALPWDIENENKNKALGGILDTFQCFRARDLYLTKVQPTIQQKQVWSLKKKGYTNIISEELLDDPHS